jgi:hypothetical protein
MMRTAMQSLLLWALLTTGALAVLAEEPAPAIPHEASIPFVGMRSIEDWRADGDGALYIQDLHRKWYHATLMGPCTDLPFAETIGIETRGIDTLDRFGTIIVRHRRCAIQSFVESGPPPKKSKPHNQKG